MVILQKKKGRGGHLVQVFLRYLKYNSGFIFLTEKLR